MQSLNDDERKAALGEVLADELKVIKEYVEDVPDIKLKVHKIDATVSEINDRLSVLENVVKEHETDIRKLKAKQAF
jgi:predicted  nucleic acid-binding Zn-ribbon protein